LSASIGSSLAVADAIYGVAVARASDGGHMLKSYRILLSAALALGCTGALGAQTPTSKETNQTIPGEITITGCVERADEVAGNSAAAATVDSLTFMLIHASKGTAAEAPVPTGTSGTSDPKAAAKGSMYRLEGDVATLNPQVGHKVELSGMLLAPTATTSDGSDSASPANAPRMKVSRVKMISETCAR
jgi:hypothetical protein